MNPFAPRLPSSVAGTTVDAEVARRRRCSRGRARGARRRRASSAFRGRRALRRASGTARARRRPRPSRPAPAGRPARTAGRAARGTRRARPVPRRRETRADADALVEERDAGRVRRCRRAGFRRSRTAAGAADRMPRAGLTMTNCPGLRETPRSRARRATARCSRRTAACSRCTRRRCRKAQPEVYTSSDAVPADADQLAARRRAWCGVPHHHRAAAQPEHPAALGDDVAALRGAGALLRRPPRGGVLPVDGRTRVHRPLRRCRPAG